MLTHFLETEYGCWRAHYADLLAWSNYILKLRFYFVNAFHHHTLQLSAQTGADRSQGPFSPSNANTPPSLQRHYPFCNSARSKHRSGLTFHSGVVLNVERISIRQLVLLHHHGSHRKALRSRHFSLATAAFDSAVRCCHLCDSSECQNQFTSSTRT